jgi:hypothetical protein
MANSLRRKAGVAGSALAAAVVAATLAGCASSNSIGTGSSGAAGSGASTVRSMPMVPAHSPTPVPTGSASVNPGGRMSPAPSPATQVTSPPASAHYVPIDQATKSADGRTLALQIEARGGACGNYVVVVQQATAQVSVGLAQLPVRTGVMCPMYIGPRIFTAKLTDPVGSRPVVDLANGSRLAP